MFSQICSLKHTSSIHTRMGGKEAVPFRLVRAENGYGFNGKERSLKKEHKRSTGYAEGKKRRWNHCAGRGEIAEVRPGGILVQHHGAAGFCNLSAMINSSEV